MWKHYIYWEKKNKPYKVYKVKKKKEEEYNPSLQIPQVTQF